MCEFKYCKGPHACFLRDISPCPGACKDSSAKPMERTERVRSRGFVDRDALAHALIEDRAESSVQSVMTVERISSKMLRALEVMGQRQT